MDEGAGACARVAEVQGALAEEAIRDESDSIGDAAVDFNVGDEALALSGGVVDAEFAQTEHREAHPEDLPGAKVAVGLRGEVKVFGERFHRSDWSNFLRGGPRVWLARFGGGGGFDHHGQGR